METKTYTYKRIVPNQNLLADVHYQRGNLSSPSPIAFMIHGGGFSTGGKEWIPRNQFDALVDLGFVVVSLNYRLCPTISLYEGPVIDCMDCYAWCKSSLPKLLEDDSGKSVDPSRMVVLGHSAGGNLALLMSQNPEPPLAILDFYGAKYLMDECWHTRNQKLPRVDFPKTILDKIWLDLTPPSSFMISQSGLQDPESPVDYSKPRLAWLASGLANGNLLSQIIPDGDYSRVDPSTYFSANFPPVFFIHGTEDKLVPAQLTERAYSVLVGLGVETELRLVEGEDHAFDEKVAIDNPKFSIIREGFGFLARHALVRK